MSNHGTGKHSAVAKSFTTAAVVLAGGQATRMHGVDKGLVALNGKPLVSYVLDALKTQVDCMVVSANRSQSDYAALGVQTVTDSLGDSPVTDFLGPLAGIAAAMRAVDSELLFICPCDSPFLCGDIVERLRAPLIAADADIAVAHDGERPQPVFALIRCALLPGLVKFLADGERKIMFWYRQQKLIEVDFSDSLDTFININTPQECASAEKRLAMQYS